MRNLLDMISDWEIEGKVFEASAILTLSAGVNTSDVITPTDAGYSFTAFKATTKPVVFFSRQVSYNGDGFYAYAMRGASYTGGTLVTEINNANDIDPLEPTVEIVTGIPGANISDIGVYSRMPKFVFGNASNQGNGGALQTIETPQYIAPGDTLLLVFKNVSTSNVQKVASHLRWAEPDRIPFLWSEVDR